MTDLLTMAQAAHLAGVTPATLRQAIRDGRLAATKIGRDWTVTRAEIERYIAERRPGYPRTGTTILHTPSLPNMWIVEHGGEIWMVPSTADGWQLRKPYRGHRVGLQPVDEATARLMIQTTGIPS